MKVIKVFCGLIAIAYGVAVFLKLVRNLLFSQAATNIYLSQLVGGAFGVFVAGYICYICFKGVFNSSSDDSGETRP